MADIFLILFLHNSLALPLCILYSKFLSGKQFSDNFTWKKIKTIRWQWVDAFLNIIVKVPYILGLEMIGFGDAMAILVSSGTVFFC